MSLREDFVKYMRSKGIPWNETTFCNAAYSDNISMFQYLLENECPHDDPRICSRSVEKGSNEKTFEKLQWLHEHNVPWDGKTCSIAARKGNLKALKYARSKGCPWHENCLRNAIVHRNFDVVEYCLQNRCPIGNSDICHYAMDDKDHDRALRMLRLLREFSVPWGERTCSKAASTGNFQALKRSVSQGCPWDRQECANYAAQHGDIEALKWIRSQGVVFDEINATFLHAAISGNFSVVEYCVDNDFSCGDRLYANAIENFDNPIPVIKLLQKNDYPWHPSACKAATILEDLKLLRWLRFNGCSWDEETCNAAVMNDNFDILKYAHENGCRWTKETYAYCFSYYGLDNEYSIIPTAAEIECLQAIFDYLIKHKCPKPDPGDWIIVE
ncbi:hypothetical protein CTEN210_09795 [Chaetoceros tenuissimus]|uniref:Uncharacterized protein n=1 Tax=Chaetoceros tenuissimus TaxID=426638 RepID=A0AAD3CWT3_9STRA|nr:hypothetical protein CTEN210_09795 [Chaetoceros tenuissimus]